MLGLKFNRSITICFVTKVILCIYICINVNACKYDAANEKQQVNAGVDNNSNNNQGSNSQESNIVLPIIPQCDGPCTCDEVVVKYNDTGALRSAESLSSNLSFCSFAILLGQDCRFGRDSDNTLDKIGTGNGGFDFNKVSSEGDILFEEAPQWDCVNDNHTGLMWEVKHNSQSANIRNNTNTFSWSLDEFPEYISENNGECNVIGECDTQAYIDNINNNQLCGFDDWRLPTRHELQDIVDYGSYQPSIDTKFFPRTKMGFYWTSSIDTDDIGSVWQVGFYSGRVAGSPTSDARFIRLVREYQALKIDTLLASSNEQDITQRTIVAPIHSCNSQAVLSAPISRFKQDLQGNILDTQTGLIWKRCIAGLSGQYCNEGEPLKMSWIQALMYAERVTNNETEPLVTSWRLPNVKELQSTVETQCEEPALNPFVFPNVPMENAWTSTPHIFFSNSSYYMQYQNSIIFLGPREEQMTVHLVRNCQ
jgi:hypothetical protein